MQLPILKTKLTPPRVPPNTLDRSRLYAKLQQGRHKKLTTVVAPAGFGKSTLVSQWLTQAPPPYGWLALDEMDNEPKQFLRYFISALQSCYSGYDGGLLSLLETSAQLDIHYFISLIINELCEYTDSGLLILEDYHVIQHADIHMGLSYLLQHLPPPLHLYLLSRHTPEELPIARLRAHQSLNEINFRDLAFDKEETKALFNTKNITLTPEDTQHLQKKTEGWGLGLQLVIQSLHHAPDTKYILKAFSGNHRYIMDFISDEIFNHLEKEIQDFLLQTAILKSFNSSLCAAITDHQKTTQILQTLEQRQLFLIPLDNDREWFRYHHLFSEWLHGRLEQQDPESIPSLHQRAGHWYQQQQMWEEAITHALKANDHDLAEELLEKHAPHLTSLGMVVPVLKWLEQLPTKRLLGNQILLFEYGTALVERYQIQKAEDWIQTIKDYYTQHPISSDIAFCLDILQAVLACRSHHYPLTEKYVQQALKHPAPKDANLLGYTYSLLGDVLFVQHRLDEAVKAYAMASSNYKKSKNHTECIIAQIHQSITLMSQGMWIQAHQLFLEIEKQLYAHQLTNSGFTSWLLCKQATIYYYWNELEQAAKYIQQALRFIKVAYPIYIDIEANWDLTCYALYTRNWDLVYLSLKRTKNIIATAPDHHHRVQSHSNNLKAVAALYQGNIDTFKAWAETLIDTPDRLPDFPHVVTLAYYYLLLEQWEKAHNLLTDFQVQHFFMNRLHYLCIHAYVHHIRGEHQAAILKLNHALELAYPQKILRIFVDNLYNLSPILAMIQNTPPPSVPLSFIEKIQSLVESNPYPYLFSAPLPPNPALALLSDRESEIMKLIANGLTNAAITEQLFISPNTLKTHIRNIYQKLEVKSREEAIKKIQIQTMIICFHQLNAEYPLQNAPLPAE